MAEFKSRIENIRLYSKDELTSMNIKDLIVLMRKYSLIFSRMRKKEMVDEILNYQNQRNNIISTLVTNNPIEKHHRGIVSYNLSPLIISQIIKMLWHNDIYLRLDINSNSNVNTFPSKLKALQRLALVSKEFFKLISSLFNRIAISRSTHSNERNFRDSLLSPFSVMKRITHLTLDLPVFNEMVNSRVKKTCYALAPIETGLLFGSVEKLVLVGPRDKWLSMTEAKLIVKNLPQLKSLDFQQIIFNND